MQREKNADTKEFYTTEDVREANQDLRNIGIHHGFPLGLGKYEIEWDADYHFLNEVIGVEQQRNIYQDVLNFSQAPLAIDVYNQDGTLHASEIDKEKTKLGEIHRWWRLSRPWQRKKDGKVFKNGIVFIIKGETGKFSKIFAQEVPQEIKRLIVLLTSYKVRVETSLLEAEEIAQEKLQRLTDEVQWTSYRLTDTLAESGRSGICYILRKNRPTLAFRGNWWQPLCALCLHPLAYYSNTYIGAMPPTDEVISHLLMIRADEHFFWRKANQIPIKEWQSGV